MKYNSNEINNEFGLPSQARRLVVAVVLGILALCHQALAASVNLTWNPSADTNVTGYVLYYGTTSGTYTNSVAAGSGTNFVMSGLTAGTTYYFNAVSVDANGDESTYAGETFYAVPAAVVAPSASMISVSAVTSTSVTLSWAANTNSAVSGYEFYYGSASGQYTHWQYVPGTSTSLVISGLTPGNTYYFNAVTLGSNGQSPLVGEVAATVSAPLVTPVTPTATLAIAPVSSNGVVTALNITASGSVPNSWAIQSSSDLVNWTLSYAGTGQSVNVNIPVNGAPNQFFRLVKN